MTELHAFLYSCDEGDRWVISTFGSLEPLMTAVRALQVDGKSALIHVGFWQPTIAEVEAMVARFPGSLILSDSAVGALCEHLSASAAVIGCIRGVAFRLAVAEQMPACAAAEAAKTAEIDWRPSVAPKATDANDHAPGRWVTELASTNEALAKLAFDSGIVDDDSYLALEASLTGPLRRNLGLARFALVSRAQPNPDTILEHLWASPPWFMDLKLSRLGLTVRQSNVFRDNNLLSIADIAPMGFAGLMKLPNLGQGSVYGLGKLLHAALLEGRGLQPGRLDVSPHGAAAGLSDTASTLAVAPEEAAGLDSLNAGVESAATLLSDAERQVWVGRLGYRCSQLTLQELADVMGVTRERVRQIEIQAYRKVENQPCWEELAIRLECALMERSTALFLNELSAIDAWFAEAPSFATALASVLRHLLPDRFDAFQVRGAWVVSRLQQREWNEACQSARALLESQVKDRIDESAVRSRCDQLLAGKGEELRDELWTEATANALWSSRAGQPRRLVSLRRGAEDVVRAVLESADEPLHFTEIHRRAAELVLPALDVRSIQNAAISVGILFNRGTYGIADHCPLADEELALVRAEVEDVVSGGEPARQWHASELCDALLDRGLAFDGRLTKYVVNHALKGSARLVDLRRMVWGLSNEWQAGAAARLDVRQAVIDLLEHEGRPMTTAEVRERLTKVRGVNQTFQIHASDPLARIGAGLWGLMYRDVNVREAQALVARIRSALQERQSGLHVTELPLALGLPHGAEVDASVLAVAEAGGIRIDRGQYVYLSERGTSGRVYLPEAVKAAVADVGATGIAFDDLCQRVNTLTQREVPRQLVSQALGGLDMCFDPVSRLWAPGTADVD